jgi:Fe-S cluster assembly protein SufB
VDAETTYIRLKDFVRKQGVTFLRMEDAVKSGIAKKWFSKAVGLENQIAALNTTLWSGGVFIHVPKCVKLNYHLHAFFTMTLPQIQFERTILVVEDNATLKYVEGCLAPSELEGIHAGVFEGFVGKNAKLEMWTLQNWAKTVVNIPVKRIFSQGRVSWTTINIWAKEVHAYPTVIGGKAENREFSYVDGNAVKGGPRALNCETFSLITKSVIKDGYSSFLSGCKGGKGVVECDAIHLTEKALSQTAPTLEGEEVIHEARGGRLSPKVIFYLKARGIPEKKFPA